MTTIAWDGETLAVDSQMTDSYDAITGRRVQKLFKVGERWIALSGDMQDCVLALRWFQRGEPEGERPELNNFVGFVKAGRDCYRYEKKLARWKVENPAATGSGYQYALGAMASGKTAGEAIKIAARFDSSTGGIVQESQ